MSQLCMKWPKYWSFSFSISPSNEHPGLISFRMDWLDLLAVQGTLKSLLQHHIQKHQFFGAQLSSQHLCSYLLKTFFFLIFANYYPSGSVVKSPLPRQKAQVQSLRQKDSPEEGNGNPLQYSCLGNPMDRGAWWAPVHEVTKESDTT